MKANKLMIMRLTLSALYGLFLGFAGIHIDNWYFYLLLLTAMTLAYVSYLEGLKDR